MHREEKAVLAALVLCAVSLALLHAITVSDVDPTGQVNASVMRPGETVTFDGEVLDIRPTASGGHLTMKLLTPSGALGVFVPRSAGAGDVAKAVHRGDRVQVTGRMETYEGEPELVVGRASDVVVVG